jgi:hypothetical protein
MPWITEFMTFTVRLGAEARALEWMQLLVERQAECIQTLDREAMQVESIFRSEREGRMQLSWYSIQGTLGAHVRDSPFEIDQWHMAFWRECIDDSVPPQKFVHVVDFLPAPIEQAMKTWESTLNVAG